MASEPRSRVESGFISLALEIRTLPAARGGGFHGEGEERAIEGVDGGADAEGLVADDPEKALVVGEAFS